MRYHVQEFQATDLELFSKETFRNYKKHFQAVIVRFRNKNLLEK